MPPMDHSSKEKSGDNSPNDLDTKSVSVEEIARQRILDDLLNPKLEPSENKQESKVGRSEDSSKGNPEAEKPINKPSSEQTDQPAHKDSKASDKTKPLTSEEVEKEAKLLQELANKFLSGDHEMANFEAWHVEMLKLAPRGIDSVKSVFEKIEKDNAGINPFNDCVRVVRLNDGSMQIMLSPSTLNGALLMNYRHIGAIIGKDASVFSSADSGRIIREHHTKYSPSSDLNSLDFRAPIYP